MDRRVRGGRAGTAIPNPRQARPNRRHRCQRPVGIPQVRPVAFSL